MSVWDDHADWWATNFASGDDVEYVDQILPLIRSHCRGAHRVLHVGAGEGQCARTALEAGAEVVAVDRSRAMTGLLARRSPPEVSVVTGDVVALPLIDAWADVVIACLVIEHVDKWEAMIDEVARVLRTDGRFLLVINHPLMQTPDSGWIDDHILEERYWRVGPYLHLQMTYEQVDDRVTVPFSHRPLHRYLNRMAEAGLLLTHMQEPSPPPAFCAGNGEGDEGAHIPRLMFMSLKKFDR